MCVHRKVKFAAHANEVHTLHNTAAQLQLTPIHAGGRTRRAVRPTSPDDQPLQDQPTAPPPGLRGLHSFRFQLNLSSSVHRVTQLSPTCVLELLKLSANVNEYKPLPGLTLAVRGVGHTAPGCSGAT